MSAACWKNISIHALLAESDGTILKLQCVLGDFYPRSPCGERRKLHELTGQKLVFLSTLSLRRATTNHDQATKAHQISIHALLAESDVIMEATKVEHQYFYPRSPCGERHMGVTVLGIQHNFYPRSPCGERQQAKALKVAALRISIHALLAESDSMGLDGRFKL